MLWDYSFRLVNWFGLSLRRRLDAELLKDLNIGFLSEHDNKVIWK